MSEQRHDPPGSDPDERRRLLEGETPWRKRVAQNNRKRQRYAEDEEFRRKTLDYNKAWRKEHQEQINAWVRQHRATHPEVRNKDNARHRGKSEDNRRKALRRYGLSVADYDGMWSRQGGVCAICGSNPEGKLHVDHDHDRKYVRELLCRGCNFGLGFFKDRPSLCDKAAAYLRKHGRKD